MNAATIDAYRQQAVGTADPARLILMLFDRSLVALERSGMALRSTPIGTDLAHRELIRAQEIVTELSLALDHESAPELAANLDSLYRFCSGQLVAANLAKDPEGLTVVSEILAGLREAWWEACCGGAG